jgi:hypothetical protein
VNHSDVAAFRLRPRSSGGWSPLVLASAAPLDVLLALEFVAEHAANSSAACSPAGAHSAAAVQLALARVNPAVALVCECLLVMLVARHLDCDRPN